MLTPEEVKALADGLTRSTAHAATANLMAAAAAKISVITVRMQTATMSAVYTR